MKWWWLTGLVAVPLFCVLAAPERDRILLGQNDFVAFYTAAKLAGTPGLYDVAANHAEQRETIGHAIPAISNIRPPFYALLMRPSASLSHGLFRISVVESQRAAADDLAAEGRLPHLASLRDPEPGRVLQRRTPYSRIAVTSPLYSFFYVGRPLCSLLPILYIVLVLLIAEETYDRKDGAAPRVQAA